MEEGRGCCAWGKGKYCEKRTSLKGRLVPFVWFESVRRNEGERERERVEEEGQAEARAREQRSVVQSRLIGEGAQWSSDPSSVWKRRTKRRDARTGRGTFEILNLAPFAGECLRLKSRSI